MKEITQKFNLPKYIHGKSFAEASKIIEGKFKGRTDKEAMDTKEDLMSRLRDAQEYVKEVQAYKEEPAQPAQAEEPTHAMPDGTEMPGAQHQMAYGGYKDTNKYATAGFLDVDDTDKRPYGPGNGESLNSELEIGRDPQLEQRLNNSYTDGKKDTLSRGVNEFEQYGVENLSKTENLDGSEETYGKSSVSDTDVAAAQQASVDSTELSKLEKGLMTAGNLAPSAMNLAQLAMLKKPKEYRGAKINSTYEKQMTDEGAMQNAQNVENAGQRNAMRSNSGSQSMLLSNLRGQGLNALKGQGAAYAQSVANNQQERKNENAFNAKKEATNVAFSRQDDEINARNEGAYDSTKSELMAGLATDVGKMSKEALMKKYPELMGMDYDWLGEFNKKQKKAKK